MYWQKSCACCKNWKSSLHVSIWLVLIRFLKIIRCRLPELSIYKGRLKSKKQHAQPIFLAEPLIPTAAPSSLPWERARERATSRKACIEVVRGLGKIAEIRGMPSPQPSPAGEGAGCSRFCGFRRFEKQLGFATVDFRPSEKEKSSQYNLFSRRTLNPNSRPVLSPRGRELERGQQAARLVFGQLGYCERLPQFGECPLPSPPPRGRERVAADFAVSGGLKSNLDLQPLIAGRLKSKKQHAQPVFLAKPLIPTATPSSLPVGES